MYKSHAHILAETMTLKCSPHETKDGQWEAAWKISCEVEYMDLIYYFKKLHTMCANITPFWRLTWIHCIALHCIVLYCISRINKEFCTQDLYRSFLCSRSLVSHIITSLPGSPLIRAELFIKRTWCANEHAQWGQQYQRSRQILRGFMLREKNDYLSS